MFGRLLVLDRAYRVRKHQYWLCHCECGAHKAIRQDALLNGRSQSCGCRMKELNGARLVAVGTLHGHTAGKKRSPTFTTWRGMRERCENPKHFAWRWYGGRGITVCERWLEFANFLADMGERPAGKTLDRWPHRKGNYEPGNCRWATKAEQSRNMDGTRIIEHAGQQLTVKEWAEGLGLKYHTLLHRLNKGWPLERALAKPAA